MRKTNQEHGLKGYIRLANLSDSIELSRLRFVFRSGAGVVNENEDEFVQRCSSWMKEHLKEKSLWRCWVAEQDGQLVGAVWVNLIEKIPNPVEESEYHSYVTNFFVRECDQGKGIGSALLSETLNWCKAHDVHAVILWPSDRSRSLDERYGFAVRADLMELLIPYSKSPS